MATIYDEVYQRARRDPEGFWAAAAEDVHWERRWDRVLDSSRPPYYRWFQGGRLNTCFNALDLLLSRHHEGDLGEGLERVVGQRDYAPLLRFHQHGVNQRHVALNR